jgi:hypothetical protein
MVMEIRPKPVDAQAEIHITGVPPSPATELTSPILVLMPIFDQWNVVDVSSGNIIVSGDFVVVEQIVVDTVGYDTSSSNFEHRSVWGLSLTGVTDNLCCNIAGSHNFMIRAEIEPIAPVGGVVRAANTLVIVAPWLAIIGLVGCIGTVAVIVKKRQS